MIDKEFADNFAYEWIEFWNSHDLQRIIEHYPDYFEMSSPYIIKISGVPSGILMGKDAVGEYWVNALAIIPDLKFELISKLINVNSIKLCYKGPKGISAEVFHLNAYGQVIRSYAHYE